MTDQAPARAYGDFVSLTVEDGIAVIRLDRPKVNALNVQMQQALGQVAADVAVDPEIAAVIVYGGEKMFAAGVDIKEMEQMGYTEMVAHAPTMQQRYAAIAAIPQPTVAAVAGYALGGGCELSMACDFRVAAQDATFGQPEILLGIIPGAGGTQRLTRLVGPAKAKDIVFTGRFVKAEEALAIGLVDELAEPGHVLEAAKAKVAAFVNGPRFALRAAKEVIDRGLDVDLDTGLAMETQQFAALFATRDRTIGMESFVRNGPGKAEFEGR